jgi:glycosyltransferase involved in cell wall biosynthesis
VAFLIIPALGAGGAERQMCELVRHLDPGVLDVHLVEIYDSRRTEARALWEDLEALPAVHLHSLRKPSGIKGYVLALPRFLALLGRHRPQVLYGFMGGTFLALTGRLMGAQVVWGIRRTSADRSMMSASERRLLPWVMRISALAQLAIFNSEAGRRSYEAMGLRSRRRMVIPNGFDTRRFAPDPEAGRAQRRAWNIPEDVPLVGLVGRVVPVKGHATFLRAAARIAADIPAAHFVCVGDGTRDYVASLRALAVSLGLGDRLHWVGEVERMPAAYNALSLLVLASTDEGCPNVVGEAMACGVPCVVTDVGDAALLVGDAGRVVPSGDEAGLAAAAVDLLREAPEAAARRSAAARERICARFGVDRLARDTEAAFLRLLAPEQGTPARHAGG